MSVGVAGHRLLICVPVNEYFGVCVESLGGRCEVGNVMMCWEMLGLWVGWQFVCVACVAV